MTAKKKAVVKKGDYGSMCKKAEAEAVAELLKFIKYLGSTQSLAANVHYLKGLMRYYSEISKEEHAMGKMAETPRDRDVSIINGKVAHRWKLLLEDYRSTLSTPAK